MIIALILIFLLILLFWLGEYTAGRRWSGSNSKISFKLFKTMHQMFPDKWELGPEYVVFQYDYTAKADSRVILSTHEFRGYFGFFDLPKYWIYQNMYNSKIRKERELKDYTEMLAAFNEMEKRIQK